MHSALKEAGLKDFLGFTICYDDPSAVKDMNKVRWAIGISFPTKEAENVKKFLTKASEFKMKEMKETDALCSSQCLIRAKAFLKKIPGYYKAVFQYAYANGYIKFEETNMYPMEVYFGHDGNFTSEIVLPYG
mmetsp:Transcript_22722/g.19746  ORF Transcript_22722/g.19746 Transcript_22722/m.19746 type:complete len:132 (-) Transcript_22722:108-503(-)|eukprot:CAMPEP_0114596958 /NCGR_PEP_ID=MMETSP0125-20121206/19164_1 /TAXON_ID=485358 ORGANISM="Aristerostoma sp., Strain ATCC 50986" /NCGR_SAMPLE_ID=MMETSP0125 /ASSEMBLY_ACC=CAM_ASM_000245 /LENGTH=131 /DNA_ID=CAMNT_0001800881 /DNA_START=204 /DNA_END=599 /DNA_ORIENTATION=-